jgi:hypothetical protein
MFRFGKFICKKVLNMMYYWGINTLTETSAEYGYYNNSNWAGLGYTSHMYVRDLGYLHKSFKNSVHSDRWYD